MIVCAWFQDKHWNKSFSSCQMKHSIGYPWMNTSCDLNHCGMVEKLSSKLSSVLYIQRDCFDYTSRGPECSTRHRSCGWVCRSWQWQCQQVSSSGDPLPHISTISRDPAAVFIFYMTAGPHRLLKERRHRNSREIKVPALVFNYKQII